MALLNNYRPEDINPAMRKYLGVQEPESVAYDSGTHEGAIKAAQTRRFNKSHFDINGDIPLERGTHVAYGSNKEYILHSPELFKNGNQTGRWHVVNADTGDLEKFPQPLAALPTLKKEHWNMANHANGLSKADAVMKEREKAGEEVKAKKKAIYGENKKLAQQVLPRCTQHQSNPDDDAEYLD